MAKDKMHRRDFLKLGGAVAAGTAMGVSNADAQTPSEFESLVPKDKGFSKEWLESLTHRGEATVYTGNDLRFIGMPIGGICAGQVYLGGDGRLWLWDIFNVIKNGVVAKNVEFRGSSIDAGGGANYVEPNLQVHPFPHSLTLWTGEGEGRRAHTLATSAWKDISFRGEYPMGFVEYKDLEAPISASLEAFSPFVPLSTDDSSFPAVVMRVTVRNSLSTPQAVTVEYVTENPVGIKTYGNRKRSRPALIDESHVFGVQLSLDTQERDRPDFGDFTLAMVGRDPEDKHGGQTVDRVYRTLQLGPHESKTVSFILAWRFPNLNLPVLGDVGHHYATRFASSGDVAREIARRYDELYANTKLWHETWYESTLPHWLLERVMGNTATLATMTCLRFANGRFYGWEGIGCCEGTCGHVWQYAQAMARLFPDLERTVREMVDFGVAFHEDSGIIEFRGEYGNGYATDAQAGYVMRAYREHQTSTSPAFLKRVWPRAKKALQYLIEQGGSGIISNGQHNTLDVDLYGPSSWLSSLYLTSLLAGEQMALEIGDHAFAKQCREIFEKGKKRLIELTWNGDYFIQKVDESHPEALRYGDGCEVDQVMGQWWAWQLGLERVIDKEHTRKALATLFRNNVLKDIGPYRDRFKPGRWYATPGEGGLIMCTFPKGDREQILGNKPTWASMYFNECMTGFEYEAAGHMVWEGMVREGLAITRLVHDRYSATKRNPWNEVECSDHYARCMSVYAVYLGLCGFEYHGPKGHIGFAPRLAPEHFKAAFTGAEGWGSYEQRISGSEMNASIDVKWGALEVSTIALEAPSSSGNVEVELAGLPISGSLTMDGNRALVTLTSPVSVEAGLALKIVVS